MKLSYPSKMPGASVGLPAILACATGGKLAQIPGSVCHVCYATGGFYNMRNVMGPRMSNWEQLKAQIATADGRKAWIAEMVQLITEDGVQHFRWHDSGDIISAAHLDMICEVAKLTPTVAHWLPTREYKMVQEVAFERDIPSNLTIRLSAHMIGRTLEPAGPFVTSSVDSGTGWQCPATHNPAHKGKCMDCRACWDRRVGNVDYSEH